MREQIEGLPEGVVKAHMGKALAQLEAELGLAASTAAAATAPAPAPAPMDTSAPSQQPQPQGQVLAEQSATAAMLAARLGQAGGVKVKGPKDALALAVHAIMLEEGFACFAEEEHKGGPTGFAPPVRAVPLSKLVPAGWNADPANVCLTYRHDRLKGRDLNVCVYAYVVTEGKNAGLTNPTPQSTQPLDDTAEAPVDGGARAPGAAGPRLGHHADARGARVRAGARDGRRGVGGPPRAPAQPGRPPRAGPGGPAPAVAPAGAGGGGGGGGGGRRRGPRGGAAGDGADGALLLDV